MSKDDLLVIQSHAENMRAWYEAYLAVGFTEDQAMALCTRTQVNCTTTISPEMNEFMSRMTAMLNAGTE